MQALTLVYIEGQLSHRRRVYQHLSALTTHTHTHTHTLPIQPPCAPAYPPSHGHRPRRTERLSPRRRRTDRSGREPGVESGRSPRPRSLTNGASRPKNRGVDCARRVPTHAPLNPRSDSRQRSEGQARCTRSVPLLNHSTEHHRLAGPSTFLREDSQLLTARP